ncbi:MAG: thimet oligopeptidase [Pseudonocardiales bacterium]|jgi:thimet oligopeptidase|nr:thimet oligopeptidase [Pseudonocardiales bacterium]
MDEPLSLPADGWHDWLADVVDGHLSTARETLDRLKDGTTRGAVEVLELWNDADIALRGADSIARLLSEVHSDPDVRTLAETRSQQVDRLRTDRGLDRALFDVIAGTDSAGLDPEATRLREHVLRDFRRSGVDRDELVRARLREISERLTVVDQDFARVIREDVRVIRIDPASLAGLPADFVEAHPVGEDGLVALTTDYPDYLPFRTFARDADARRELTVAFLNRGWPDNDSILREMLDLRDEHALLLGYENWPAYDAEVKMVGTAEAIGEFIEKLADASEEVGRRDLDAVMQRLRQDEPDAQAFDASHLAYYTELIRRENYDVDAQEVRRFFDFANVRRGLLDVTGRLFDVEYREVDVATWHEDVTAYDVLADGDLRGRIYLDLHPRAGKFKHAAQFDLVGGIAGRQRPEGVLVCNFPRGLMEHQHVVTLFHEFGHLLHHVLGGQQRWARFSGVATEWDFVEAPSQMLEEWAWDADILRSFAVDAEGTPISSELVERMRAAKDFGKGMLVRNQVFYTAVSYVLHRDRPTDLTQVVQELQARYDLVDYLEGTHFHAAFGHLAGYTSAYYTYLWSLVIAKDLFSAFDPADLFDAEVARRYRDRILGRGGAADAASLVADFLGRPFSFDAFAEWLDRAPVAVR